MRCWDRTLLFFELELSQVTDESTGPCEGRLEWLENPRIDVFRQVWGTSAATHRWYRRPPQFRAEMTCGAPGWRWNPACRANAIVGAVSLLLLLCRRLRSCRGFACWERNCSISSGVWLQPRNRGKRTTIAAERLGFGPKELGVAMATLVTRWKADLWPDSSCALVHIGSTPLIDWLASPLLPVSHSVSITSDLLCLL